MVEANGVQLGGDITKESEEMQIEAALKEAFFYDDYKGKYDEENIISAAAVIHVGDLYMATHLAFTHIVKREAVGLLGNSYRL